MHGFFATWPCCFAVDGETDINRRMMGVPAMGKGQIRNKLNPDREDRAPDQSCKFVPNHHDRIIDEIVAEGRARAFEVNQALTRVPVLA